MKHTTINELYKEHGQYIENCAKKLAYKIPSEEIEDLTQAAWENIIKKYVHYDDKKGKIQTWLYMILVQTITDMIRSKNTEGNKVLYIASSIDERLYNGQV